LIEGRIGKKDSSKEKDLHDIVLDLVDEIEMERFVSLTEAIFQLAPEVLEQE
jgi:hypothetical protein